MSKKLIVISAMWCPSCLLLNKNLKLLKEEYNLDFIKLDYDLDNNEVLKYNIDKKLPVLLIYQNDKEIDRCIGEKSLDELKEFLKRGNII